MKRANPETLRAHGEEGAFFSTATSTARVHIRSHYDEYKKRCKEAGIEEQDHAKPPALLAQELAAKAVREAEEKGDEKKGTLKAMGFTKRLGPKEFSKESVLEHTAKFVACTSQVSVSVMKG